MKTWAFKYAGNFSSAGRKTTGTSIVGEVKLRAVSIDDALAKFYRIFTAAPVVRITSIVEED